MNDSLTGCLQTEKRGALPKLMGLSALDAADQPWLSEVSHLFRGSDFDIRFTHCLLLLFIIFKRLVSI